MISRCRPPAELRRHPDLEGAEPNLLEAGNLSGLGADAVEIEIGPATPKPESLADVRDRSLRMAESERLLTETDVLSESVDVHLFRREQESIAGRTGAQGIARAKFGETSA